MGEGKWQSIMLGENVLGIVSIFGLVMKKNRCALNILKSFVLCLKKRKSKTEGNHPVFESIIGRSFWSRGTKARSQMNE